MMGRICLAVSKRLMTLFLLLSAAFHGVVGAMAYQLPAGSSRARLVVGMSYDNPDCHGVITVGPTQQGATMLYDQYHIGKQDR